MEMSTESLVVRMLCSRARVDAQNIREGNLTVLDFSKLASAAGKIAKAPLHIDDTPALTVTSLRSKMMRMVQLYGIKLAVIDYLQLMAATARRSENRQQEIAVISGGVKAMAKDFGIPVIVLSQLNREVDKGGGKKAAPRKPRMSDLRESGAIEQDADVIGLLYKPNEDEDQAVELVIAKQRNGPTDDVPLTFLKQYTRFENAARV
jgi:replicative DNA helicase